MRDLDGARVLVCGASGVVGGDLTERLVGQGARVVAAGRSARRLTALSERLGGLSCLTFDAVDLDSCRRVVDQAAEALGGLDGIVVATGVAAFGSAMDADDAVTEELFAVNVLAPMALVRAAGRHLQTDATIVVLSAILADVPTAGMAEYSASKSALSTWLTVLRREQRGHVTVVDVRPPHLDTGLAERALAGSPPQLPEPFPARELADAVIRAIREQAREVVYDLRQRTLTVR